MIRKHIVIDARNRRSSTGRYTDRLIEHLQDIDDYHRYTILVQPDDNWKMRAGNFTALPCPFPQFSVNPLHELRFARQLYNLKPDLVHFTMTQQPLLYFGDIVTTTHDLTMFNFVRRGKTPKILFAIKMWLYKVLFLWSHVKSKKVIVPTKFVASDLISYQPSTAKKIVVTYESGELPIKAPAQRPEKVGAKDEFILYVGMAFPHKNLPRLVDAFDILKKKHPHLKLVLVGKREINSYELEDYARTHPSFPEIIFTGFVSNEELKWLFEHCQAYVWPSLSEGFGLSPLEAMANGAPVVSSNASCMPEVYGDAAYYFDPTNPQDIADKVDDVLNDTGLRKTLVKKGREQLKEYSWHHMANETMMVYKELLKEVAE